MNPKFSVVVPLYKVEDYIQDLLDTFTFQTPGNYTIEYIFVDDGSPDRSGEIVSRWISQTATPARLVVQDNQGVSAARNVGISLAKGEWITFPDSDDFLDREYFKSVAEFLEASRNSNVSIIAANIIRYFDENKRYRNTHALRFKFASGDAIVDLEQNPNFIQLSAPTTFYRREHLIETGIKFRVGLHASEDALFTSEILLTEEAPKLGVVKNARYYYRKRATADSAVDAFSQDPNTYFERFESGYLVLAEKALEEYGYIPRWFVSLILYEYRWLFSYETKLTTRANVLSVSQRQKFIELTMKILDSITPGEIEDYRVTPMQFETRLLLMALAGEVFPNQGVRVVAVDDQAGQVEIKYWFTGEIPKERFISNNTDLPVLHAKIRTLPYFGQTVLRERIVWVPLEHQLEVEINGKSVRIDYGLPALRRFQLTSQEIKRRYGVDTSGTLKKVEVRSRMNKSKLIRGLRPMGLETKPDVVLRATRSAERRARQQVQIQRKKQAAKAALALQGKLAKELKDPNSSKKYAESWILMDRVDAAGDNAEHVYRYLMRERPDINAWFALKRDCRDWQRLEREGFKLIEYGSFEFNTALCLARNFVSSHADVEMTDPLPAAAYPGGVKPWKFSFLQHGVIQSDLSAWLNPKKIDLFVTSTHDEYKSIAGDDSPYVFSSKEVVLTGLPRHDNLVELAEASTDGEKYLLISPTWRHFLVQPKVVGTGERAPAGDFYESLFYRSWMSVLTDPRLFEIAKEQGYRIGFLPHPNLEEALAQVALDSRIERFSYRTDDIQTIFAQTKVFVTDYSSVAFDLSFVGAEIHYFQFDRDEMFGGKHTMAKGYFEHQSHGFGPVHESADTLLGLDTGIASMTSERIEGYRERVKSTFAYIDSNARSRVVEKIENLAN